MKKLDADAFRTALRQHILALPEPEGEDEDSAGKRYTAQMLKRGINAFVELEVFTFLELERNSDDPAQAMHNLSVFIANAVINVCMAPQDSRDGKAHPEIGHAMIHHILEGLDESLHHLWHEWGAGSRTGIISTGKFELPTKEVGDA